MTDRRELVASVGLCLLGSALVLLAVSRAWVSYRLVAAAPLPSKTLTVAGTHLAPGARALALVGLAGVAAVPATRRLGRLLVGLLLTAAGAGTVAVVVRAVVDPDAALRRAGASVDVTLAAGRHFGAWPYAALLGGALIAAGGVLTVLRGGRWSELSARYDAPTAQVVKEPSMWERLDRGEDPTDGGGSTGG